MELTRTHEWFVNYGYFLLHLHNRRCIGNIIPLNRRPRAQCGTVGSPVIAFAHNLGLHDSLDLLYIAVRVDMCTFQDPWFFFGSMERAVVFGDGRKPLAEFAIEYDGSHIRIPRLGPDVSRQANVDVVSDISLGPNRSRRPSSSEAGMRAIQRDPEI